MRDAHELLQRLCDARCARELFGAGRGDFGDHFGVFADFWCDFVDEFRAGSAGGAAEAVVGGHDLLDAGLGDELPERGEVGFAKVPFADAGVEAVAVALEPGMDREMLGAGMGLGHCGGRAALEAPHDGRAHRAGEKGIFAVGFHAAAPARVAEDVDVRSPEGEAAVAVDLAALGCDAVLDAALVRDGVEDGLGEGWIEGGRQSYGLGEGGGGAVAGHAVKGFAPPVVCGDAQTLYAGGIEEHEGGLLFERELLQEVGSAQFGREGPVCPGNVF